ncbi:MAG: hypothetical protein ACYDGM_03560 [Vulcanimicrobiaceae bacterium]
MKDTEFRAEGEHLRLLYSGKFSAHEPFAKLDELDYSRCRARDRRPSHAFAPRSPHRGSFGAEPLPQLFSKRRASRSKPGGETVDGFDWNKGGNRGIRVPRMVGIHSPTETGESGLLLLEALRRTPATPEEKTRDDNPRHPVRELSRGREGVLQHGEAVSLAGYSEVVDRSADVPI